jgi:oxygen-independent coproporphyrinogen-3 oxidase
MTTPESIRTVYVHIPFCRRLCGYCDFYSGVPTEGTIGPLVDALLRELDGYSNRHELALETVLVGGGTPTSLPARELRRLLIRLSTLARRGAALEFTVEANPETVTPEIAMLLGSAGVNRVSIGAQSFDPADLAMLDRSHRVEQVAETVSACRAAGIAQVNLDLIFAIPGQTSATWLKSLKAAMALQSEHLSCYSLTFEPGTRLFEQLQAGAIERIDEDLDATLYEQTIDTLTAAGYGHYEISNFARPGCECRHNLAYWHNEPHVGIGPSAAGLVAGVRYRNVTDVAAYTRAVLEGRSPRTEEERRSDEQQARETAMLELRLTEGIDRRRFRQRYGADPVEFFAEPVQRHGTRGLLEVTDTHLRLTRSGLLLGDLVIADFL